MPTANDVESSQIFLSYSRSDRDADVSLRAELQGGAIPFAEFGASVQGWINHVRYANSWGLRRPMLAPFRPQRDAVQDRG